MFTQLWNRAGSKTHRPSPDRVRTTPARWLRFEQLEDRAMLSASVVLEWNQLTLDSIRLTGTNSLLGGRAVAITQAAVYDAVNAIDGTYTPYAFNGQAAPGASLEAAAATAAYHTLIELFPTRRADFDAALASSLADVPDGPSENQGVAVGRAAAASILALRRHDGFDAVVPYTPGTDPGDWQPTPPAFLAAFGAQWPQVTPFAMSSGAQFRPSAPPALSSAEYATAFNEVLELGRDTSTTRTADQTEIAFFWRDAGGTSFAFGHWNIIAQDVAEEQGLDLVGEARLFAQLNLAMADAALSCWDAKFAYDFWRPVTAIRAADTDGNPDTTADTTWTSLIAAPNFPSYTSGHSTVSRSAATVLTAVFGANYHFTTGSEGLAGVTRSFDSFVEAAEEAGQSRIYGGIHFQFDNVAAQEGGVDVGNYVLDNFLLPRDDGADQLRAAAAAPAPVNVSIRSDQVQPLLAEALTRWQAAGVDTSALRGIDVRIADLGGLTLGMASGNTIWLDDNAAGWGWFVDATPWEDSEFTTPSDQGEEGRMDLLTVLEHEIGHLLGYEHDESGLMQEALTAGTRRTIGPVAAEDSLSDAFQLFSADEDAGGISDSIQGRNGKRK
jgi:membrane-associated phospholipid phosphatase